MTTAAVVLAAGEGSRFAGGTHKLLADFRGRPLWSWAVDAAVGAALDETYVVLGAVELALTGDITIVRNPAWADGQAGSLSAGVAAAAAAGHDAVVVGLADQPLIGPDVWRAVAASTTTPIRSRPSPATVALRCGSRPPSGRCCPRAATKGLGW